VIQGWAVGQQFFQLSFVHQARLSMTFRQLKLVEIKLTGTPVTRSISSTNRKVS
jgi:hypothetical protein